MKVRDRYDAGDDFAMSFHPDVLSLLPDYRAKIPDDEFQQHVDFLLCYDCLDLWSSLIKTIQINNRINYYRQNSIITNN